MEPSRHGAMALTIEVLARGLIGGPPRPFTPESGPGVGETYRLFRLLDLLHMTFGDRVVVYLIEPFSLTWIARVIRHRPRRYPAFIIGGREVIAGLDEAAVIAEVTRFLASGTVVSQESAKE